MDCYINYTGSFLPGEPIPNALMHDYLGTLEAESDIREKILRMNGIKSRHYALDSAQNSTHDLYDLARLSVQDCVKNMDDQLLNRVSYLSAGSTNAPLVGPGLASIIHDRLAGQDVLKHSVEINSNSGICTASAQSLVNAVRAVRCGEHEAAISIGVEQPSDILKSSMIRPVDDRDQHEDVRQSEWFMSVFLRSMLSDGAGAMLLSNAPNQTGVSFKVNWTHSMSFAHETPLCMKLENRSLLLSQNVETLARYMKPSVEQLLTAGFEKYDDDFSTYHCVLPHLSSFFFKRYLLSSLKQMSPDKKIDYWTNLESSGNTGAASIYVILDEYRKTQAINNGDKVLLFIPESGQFNFVLVSLTVVVTES